LLADYHSYISFHYWTGRNWSLFFSKRNLSGR